MSKFNSQVCTSAEQSKRLLKLGLKPETADMHITNMSIKGFQYTDQWQIGSNSYKDVMSFWTEKGLKLENTYWEIIPAWSLHRLLEMYVERYISCNVNLKELTFDWLIDEIGIHITENDFNKEYLKQ